MMKKILTIITAGMILIGCQTTEKAQAGIEIIDGPPITVNPPVPNPKVTDWYKGDIVGAQTLCKDEESIMKIVMADTKSAEAVRMSMYLGSMTGDCVIMSQPVGVPIMDIVAEYLDFAKRPSVVLVVALPRYVEGGIAYIIAGGRRGPPKEEKKGRDI
tara:strand:- start:956 stop:1429 length:474 start_codon:yes stop_codon:yes gene_type:complete